MQEGFTTIKVILATAVPSDSLGKENIVTHPITNHVQTPQVDLSTGIGSAADPSDHSWTDSLNDFIFEPSTPLGDAALNKIGDALGHGLHTLFTGILQYSPTILVILGIVCFLLTMAVGKGKPYGWGLGFWTASAIMRVIGHGFGL